MAEEVVNNNTQVETVKYNKVPAIVMLCVSIFVGGIIGIVFAAISLAVGSGVAGLYAEGKIEEAKRKLKSAKGFLIVTYVWDGLVAALVVFMIVAAIIAAAAGELQ